MECNKDEALRSRIIAEQRFLQHDLVGAKKFALKAQYLFPDLEGLPQLIAALDVHIVAQQKVDGLELNWYGVLQTDAAADEATIRKQYRKLALTLHPDKNKAVGAEGAFKLISEAWHVLSNKDKKAAHDAKRMSDRSGCAGYSATKPPKNFSNFTNFKRWCPCGPSHSKNSFWTACPSCKMEFEYLRIHENKKLFCPTCRRPFVASEIGGMSGLSASSHQVSGRCPEKPPNMQKEDGIPEAQADTQKTSKVCSGFSFRWGNHRLAGATAEMVHQTYESVRRERVKAQEEARHKAAKEKMEAEIEERKRKHRDRKCKKILEQIGDSSTVVYIKRGRDEQIETESVPGDTHMEASSSDALNSIQIKETEVGTSPCQECASAVGERASKLDQACGPFMCRMRNSCDKTKSYDSSDNLSTLKRLKVDV